MDRDLLIDAAAKDKAFQAIGTAVFSTGELPQETMNILAKIGSNEQERVLRAAGRVAHQLINNLGRVPEIKDEALSRILSLTPSDAHLVRDLIAYLAHMKSMDAGLKKLGLSRATAIEMSQSAEPALYLSAQAANVDASYPSTVADMLSRFKYLSLNDRSAARDLYKQLLSVPTFSGIAHEGNIGLRTYFREDELPQDANYHIDFRRQLAEQVENNTADIDTYLLFSVDPGFLRHHGVAWLNWAPFLQTQKIGLLFIVTGDKDECEAVVSEARELLAALTVFHGANTPDAYANSALFIQVEVPPTTADVITFYACARYLLLPETLDALDKPVLVVDVDMAIRNDLRPFLKAISEADFACPFSRGVAALYPWRRYMANTVYFSGSEYSRLIAADIARYIQRGLQEPRGWTLDQNALAFAIEKANQKGANLFDANNYSRPLYQESSRATFERTSLS